MLPPVPHSVNISSPVTPSSKSISKHTVSTNTFTSKPSNISSLANCHPEPGTGIASGVKGCTVEEYSALNIVISLSN